MFCKVLSADHGNGNQMASQRTGNLLQYWTSRWDYCVFNHVGHKKIPHDPTPIQIRDAEIWTDLDTAFINNAEGEDTVLMWIKHLFLGFIGLASQCRIWQEPLHFIHVGLIGVIAEWMICKMQPGGKYHSFLKIWFVLGRIFGTIISVFTDISLPVRHWQMYPCIWFLCRYFCGMLFIH